jgi:hypothetical protein
MENLSTGQNLGQNQGGSPWERGSSGGTSESPVGEWNRSRREAESGDESSESPESQDEESQEESNTEEGENPEKGLLAQMMGNVVDEAEDAAREATGEALRQSWINLFTTYGLTFLYINFHATMSYLGGPLARFFSKPGGEWASKFIKGLPVPKEYKKQIEDGARSMIEPWEMILITLVNVVIILLLFIIIFIIYVAVTDPTWFTVVWFRATTGL